MKKTKGAVSVFLVIILVPCIVVSSLFVDLGRVHMSKTMAYSSADLALNTLMTNYDYDLSDWYGMAASCQNIEDFYKVSAEFFLRTLSSQGLSKEELYTVSSYYAAATDDTTIYDLLQIECQDNSDAIVTGVKDANLSEPALIKKQVVEFMKYRAPIELSLGIVERLKKDSSVAEALQTEQTEPLVESKKEYFTAEGELLEAAYNSYEAIHKYFETATTNKMTNDKLIAYANSLNEYKSVYYEIHKIAISNLLNTDGLQPYYRVTLDPNTYIAKYDKTSWSIRSREEKDDDDVKHYYIDGSRITSLLDSLQEKIGKFNDARTNFSNAAAPLMQKINESNEVQWWVQMDQAVNKFSTGNYTAKVRSAGEDLLDAYAKVLAIKDCELGKEIPSDWETRFNTLTSQASSLEQKYLQSGVTDSYDGYLSAVSKLEEVSQRNVNKIKSTGNYVTVNGQSQNIDNALATIANNLNAMKTEMKTYIDMLDLAIDGNAWNLMLGSKRVRSLDTLLELAQTYETTFNTWSNTADAVYAADSSITMAEKDQEEIKKINDEIGNKITAESVSELKTRLVNIRSQFQAIVDGIDSLKYGPTKLLDIKNFNKFRNASVWIVSKSKIGLTNQEIQNYADETFPQLFKPSTDPVFTLQHTDDAHYNPEINPASKQVQTPALYVYFYERFKSVEGKEAEIDKNQEEKDEGNKKAEDKANAAKNESRYNGGGKEVPKDYSGNSNFSLLKDSLSAIMEVVEIFNDINNVSKIRDDLYTTAYIMEMFSYGSYENQGLYDLVEKKTELELGTDGSNGFRPKEYNDVLGDATKSGTWLSASKEDHYNKSLTNKLINKENNQAYCAEVEYILVGGNKDGKKPSNDDNVKAVYSNIYGIRYALNMVSGFKNFWNGSEPTSMAIGGVATSVAGLTGGIIPEPVTKVVLILLLTVFETSKDLDRLEAGFPVELFKSEEDDWWIKVPAISKDNPTMSDITGILDTEFNGPNQDEGLFYSDYLTVFVYLGLQNKDTADAMYERMGEVIQLNMGHLTEAKRNELGMGKYSLKNSQVYFQLDATIRVKPLMITLPYFDSYDNDLETNTDWCTYDISIIRGY